MKKIYLFSMLFCLAMAFTTPTTKAVTQTDSIKVTLWSGITDSIYNISAGSIWVTGDFTAPIVHSGSGFWWFVPMQRIGKLGTDTVTIWYKTVIHYKPGSLVDSSVSTRADANGKLRMSHDTAAWYFIPNTAWSDNENPTGSCNFGGWGRAIKFGTNDTILAYKWNQCENLGDPSVNTGLKQLSSSQLRISPNPATDMVKLESSIGIQSIRMMDITGRTVKNIMVRGSLQTSISVVDLPASLYLIRIAYNDGTSVTTKLLKR